MMGIFEEEERLRARQLAKAGRDAREAARHYDRCVDRVFLAGTRVACEIGRYVFQGTVQWTNRGGRIGVRNSRTGSIRPLDIEQCVTGGWRGNRTSAATVELALKEGLYLVPEDDEEPLATE